VARFPLGVLSQVVREPSVTGFDALQDVEPAHRRLTLILQCTSILTQAKHMLIDIFTYFPHKAVGFVPNFQWFPEVNKIWNHTFICRDDCEFI
jgi:hypothetical protein